MRYFIDFSGTLPAFHQRPDDQRLAATAVAAREQRVRYAFSAGFCFDGVSSGKRQIKFAGQRLRYAHKSSRESAADRREASVLYLQSV